MKKLLIGLAAPVGLVVFCAPYLSGNVAESETRRFIDQINLSPLEYGSTEIVAYERGFLSTDANYRYTLPPALQALGYVEPIDFVCQSKHGITNINFSCNVDGDNVYTKFVSDNFEGNDPFSMTGSVSVFGEINQTFSVEAIEDFPADSGSLTLAKSEITISTDHDFFDSEVVGKSEGLSLAKDSEKVTLGKLSVDGDLNKSEEGLFLGGFRVDLSDMTTTSGGDTFSVNGLNLVTSANKDGKNTDSTMSVSINEINTIDSPFKNIQNASFTVTANGINTAALVEYQTFAKQLQQDVMSSQGTDNDPSLALSRSMEVVPILEKMLGPDLFLEAKLAANLDQQPASLDISVDVLKSITFQDLQMLLATPQEILSRLDIRFQSSLKKELVDSQAILTNSVAQNSLFELSSGKYSSELVLGKETMLNGKSMSLEELQMLLIPSQPQ